MVTAPFNRLENVVRLGVCASVIAVYAVCASVRVCDRARTALRRGRVCVHSPFDVPHDSVLAAEVALVQASMRVLMFVSLGIIFS